MESLQYLANLLRQRNEIDQQIATLIQRPAEKGHIGEYIAAHIFGINLHESAVKKGSDGIFRDGPLAGQSVNVKYYGKREGILDLNADADVTSYLVMTGPKGAASSLRGNHRPFVIEAVYFFQASLLLAALQTRQIKIGIATSVATTYWAHAEIFPKANDALLALSGEQRAWLSLFSDIR